MRAGLLGNDACPVGYTAAHGREVDASYNGPQTLVPGSTFLTLTTILWVGLGEGAGLSHSGLQPVQIGLFPYDDGPHRFQMWCLPLHVEQSPTAHVHHHHQMDKCDLRRVPGSVKHGLPREQTAHRHPVETTDELVFGIPDLDRVRPTHLVELCVGVDELRSDPRALPQGSGTPGNDCVEVLIHRREVATARLTERSADVEPVERYDGSLYRRPPTQVAVGQVHREHALAVCLQHRPGAQVSSHRHHIAVRGAGVGEIETTGKRLYGHTPIVSERELPRLRILAGMRALICDEYSGIESLRVGELPAPTPAPGSVLIEVESVAVNFADTLMVTGLYQLKPDPPFAPGYEVAGTVVVANQAKGVSPGDRISGFLWYGGMAERAVIQRESLVVLPDTITSDVGASLPGTFGTSYHALVDRGRLEQDETLLVLGASGGVGMAAVQIGKALGAEVIAAVSSEAKAGAVRDAGADHVIRYDQTPLRDGIAEATKGEGVDVVYDPVGGEMTELALRSTKWNGRLLVIGFAGGSIPEIPMNLPLLKGNSVVGVFWGRFTTEEPLRSQSNFETIVEWVAEGRLHPVVQKTYSLDEGREAMQWVADRKAIGRVIINP